MIIKLVINLVSKHGNKYIPIPIDYKLEHEFFEISATDTIKPYH